MKQMAGILLFVLVVVIIVSLFGCAGGGYYSGDPVYGSSVHPCTPYYLPQPPAYPALNIDTAFHPAPLIP